MQILIKTNKHCIKWYPKKFIKNVAIAGTITTLILAYANWFINYQAYLTYLMSL